MTHPARPEPRPEYRFGPFRYDCGQLGPSEGAATGFYPSGKLKICFLAGDQTVQGVPCMTAGFIGMFGDGARRDGGAQFYESGKLKSCTLARDYASHHRGDRFLQTP